MMIGLLGWGSLLWDQGERFAAMHEPWRFDGPLLRLEFSRVSRSRAGALTLVIDPEHGTPTQVAYCLSRRATVEDSVEDLRTREKTTAENIGYVCPGDARSRSRDPATAEIVARWAARKMFEAVVWTDLPSNFEAVTGHLFSIDAAIDHIRGLEPPGREAASTYLVQAPNFVRTALRDAVKLQPELLQLRDKVV